MRLSRLVCPAIVILGTATLASAGSVTFTVDPGYQSTDNQTQIAIPQFDPSLGSLQSVDFSLQGLANIMFTLTNTGASRSMQFGITASVLIDLQDPTCTPNCSIAQDLVIAVPATYYPSTYVGTVGSEGTLASGATTGPQSLFPFSPVIDPGTLDCGAYSGLCAAVTGTGTVLDIVDMTDTTSLTASGSSKSFIEDASGDGIVTVVYNYTASGISTDGAPEPVSFLLMGAGLLAVGGSRIRRRSTN